MAKRILHKFKLDEISGVDRMAQEGAKAVIMKRDTSIAKGAFLDAVLVMEAQEAVRDLWYELWESEDAIHTAIWNIQSNPQRYPNVEDAIIEALGEYSEKVQEQAAEAAATVPSKGVEKSASDDPALKSDHSEGDDDNHPLNPEEETMSKKPEEVTVESLTGDLQGVNVKLAKAESFGKLTDIEKGHYATLDVAGQDEFLKMDEGARANVLENLVKADPVIYTNSDGEEFRKSDDPRLVKMAKQADEDRKLAKADRDRAENLELAKRVEDELSNLPGEAPAKVALLKAIDGITDEASRTAINELLKAANTGVAAAFDTHGTTDIAKGNAEEELDTLAKAHATEKDISFADAYDAILKTDKGEALYNESQKS
jgi:hypothetical protein